MIDSEDYAPHDPAVQAKADLVDNSSGGNRRTTQADPGKEPSASFTFLDRDPQTGNIVIADVVVGTADKVLISRLEEDRLLAEFTGGDREQSRTVAGGASENKFVPDRHHVLATAVTGGELDPFERQMVVT